MESGLIAANFSGSLSIGLAGAGYDQGIAVWNYEWMATLVLLFSAVLILPIDLQTKLSTIRSSWRNDTTRHDPGRSLLFIAGDVIFVMVFANSDDDWSVLPELALEDGFTLTRHRTTTSCPGRASSPARSGWGSTSGSPTTWWCRRCWRPNLDHGRWGALFACVMQLPLLVLLIFPGILARGVFEALEDSDLAWPALVFEFRAVSVRGVVIAARMSAQDSVLDGASSLEINDWVRTRDKEYTEQQLLRCGRIVVAVFMVIAAAWGSR